MKLNLTTIVASALFTGLFLASPSFAQSADGQGRSPATDGQHPHRPQRPHRPHRPVPHPGGELVRSMNFSTEQKELALTEARQAAPIATEMREKAKQIVRDARAQRKEGSKDEGKSRGLDTRTQLRSLHQDAMHRIEPMARQLAQSLTPEQHQKLVDAAQRHGRTFDDQRLVEHLSKWLARPGRVSRLQERLKEQPATR